MAIRHPAWYAKDSPIFSDTIALVRLDMERTDLRPVGEPKQYGEIPRALLARLTETVSYAVGMGKVELGDTGPILALR